MHYFDSFLFFISILKRKWSFISLTIFIPLWMDRPNTQYVNRCSLIISEISPTHGLVSQYQQQLQVLYLKPIAYLLSGICYKHYKCLFLCTQGNNREVKYLKHACTSTLHLPMHTWTVLVCTFRLQVCITYHVFCYYKVYFWSCK